MEEQAVTLNEADGQIAYQFHARDLHLVTGPAAPGTSVRFHVRIDASRRVRRTGPMSMMRATERWPDNGCTSSSVSVAQ